MKLLKYLLKALRQHPNSLKNSRENKYKNQNAPDIEILKIWDFEMDLNCVYSINGKYTSEQDDYNLAMNDGLSEYDMQFWFMPNMNKPKAFKGQIICWNDKIIY